MKKIYIIAPAGNSTGGVETLHQAVSYMNDMGADAYIVYCNDDWDKEKIVEEKMIPVEKFQSYNIKVSGKIEDVKENLLIVPEIYSKLLYRYKHIKKVILWLSWDFFEDRAYDVRASRLAARKHLPKVIFKPAIWIYNLTKGRQFNFGKDTNQILHLYNCEYIKQILIRKGVAENNTMYLCGMIRDEYLNNKIEYEAKENIIIYNPAKDKTKFAEKIFYHCNMDKKGYRIIPIKGMNVSEIKEVMKKSKVYLDFGYFPGPERMPREAVTMGCNIITSNIGAAGNDVDIPIPKKFKFSVDDKNMGKIGECITKCMEDYMDYQPYFEEYRVKVKEQKSLFVESLGKLINLTI